MRLTVDQWRALLRYEPDTGRLIWRVDRGHVVVGGQEAGSIHRTGYRNVFVLGNNYRVHRVIWMLVTGEWPAGVIDHIDGDKLNNRWANLRAVPQLLNCQNRRRGHGRSGLLGVYFRRGKFEVHIRANGRQHWLGAYGTAEAASAAYLAAKRALHDGNTL